MKHQVVCCIDKVKELILQENPDFYELGEITQEVIIDEFVKPVDAEVMFNYMIDTEKCNCTEKDCEACKKEFSSNV